MECCETTNEAVDVFALYTSVELRRGGPRLQPKPSCTQFALRNLSCDDVVSCRSSSDGRTEENEGGERESGFKNRFLAFTVESCEKRVYRPAEGW